MGTVRVVITSVDAGPTVTGTISGNEIAAFDVEKSELNLVSPADKLVEGWTKIVIVTIPFGVERAEGNSHIQEGASS
jgi:hypothetical protein